MSINLWQLGGQLAGAGLQYWAGENAADNNNEAARGLWDRASFQPYNVNTAIGSASFNGRTATGRLSPGYRNIAGNYRRLGTNFLSQLRGGNFDKLRNEQLRLLRKQARPDEIRDTADMQTMLFNKGLLGTTAGSLQMNALQDAQSDADLDRQLAAIELGRSERASLFDLASRSHNFDQTMQLLPAQQLALGGQLGANASAANLAAGQGVYDQLINESDGEGMFWKNLIDGGVDILSNFNTASTVATEAGNLFTAGGGNPFSAASLAGKETLGQTGSWADLGAGPRQFGGGTSAGSTAAASAYEAAGGYAATGATAAQFAAAYESAIAGGASASQAAMLASQTAEFGATGITMTGEALAGGASAAGGTTAAGTTAAWSGAALGATIAVPFIMAAISKFGQGGSAESAKSGKFGEMLQDAMKKDPSGASASRIINNLVTNKLWTNEGNQWVVGDLISSGAVKLNNPVLYGKDSVVNVFGDPMTLLNQDTNSRNSPANVKIMALGAGMTEAQANDLTQQYVKYRNSSNAASENDATFRDHLKADSDKATFEASLKNMSTAQRRNAQQVYTSLRRSGYTGDLSKLEKYLGITNGR